MQIDDISKVVKSGTGLAFVSYPVMSICSIVYIFIEFLILLITLIGRHKQIRVPSAGKSPFECSNPLESLQ